MVLEVAPTDDPARWRFAITYDDGRSPQRREYCLVEGIGESGRYVVEEGNGVELESWFAVDTLTQVYAVGGTELVTRWRRRGDTLTFDVTAAETGGGGGGADDGVVPAASLRSSGRSSGGDGGGAGS